MAHVSYQAPYENFVGRDSERFTPNGAVNFRRGGIPVARRFVRPRQPETPIQHAARYAFAVAASVYTGLSSTDRTSWDTLGLTITRTNPAGFTYHPSGRSLFLEQFLIAARNGEASITTAPPTVSFPPLLEPDEVQVIASPPSMIVFYPPLFQNSQFLIEICGPLSLGVRSLQGRNFFNPTLSEVDPTWIQGAIFNQVSGTDAAAFADNSLRITPLESTRWGFRLTALAGVVLIKGPTYSAIIEPHGP